MITRKILFLLSMVLCLDQLSWQTAASECRLPRREFVISSDSTFEHRYSDTNLSLSLLKDGKGKCVSASVLGFIESGGASNIAFEQNTVSLNILNQSVEIVFNNSHEIVRFYSAKKDSCVVEDYTFGKNAAIEGKFRCDYSDKSCCRLVVYDEGRPSSFRDCIPWSQMTVGERSEGSLQESEYEVVFTRSGYFGPNGQAIYK